MGKSIAIITNQFPALSEIFIVNKVLGLQEAGMQVTVCVSAKDSDLNYFEQNDDLKHVKVINLNNKRNLTLNLIIHFLEAILWFIRLKKKNSFHDSLLILLKGFLIKIQNFDIIHFEFSGIGIDHLNFLDFYKPAKLYVSCRGSAEFVTPLVNPGRKEKLAKLFMGVDRIHCVSEDIRMEIQKYSAIPGKTFINRPAVKPQLEKVINKKIKQTNKQIILSVGRLVFQKGYVYALLAIRELVKTNHDIEYHIIGQGPDLAEIKFFIEKNELQNVIILHGALSNEEVMKHLFFADIFLLPSVCEGVANSVLEAMYHSIPVVATRAGGMEEVIKDGFNGIMTDCYDPLAIKSGLEKVLLNQELRNVLGKNAHATIIDHYLLERQIDTFLKEYN